MTDIQQRSKARIVNIFLQYCNDSLRYRLSTWQYLSFNINGTQCRFKTVAADCVYHVADSSSKCLSSAGKRWDALSLASVRSTVSRYSLKLHDCQINMMNTMRNVNSKFYVFNFFFFFCLASIALWTGNGQSLNWSVHHFDTSRYLNNYCMGHYLIV